MTMGFMCIHLTLILWGRALFCGHACFSKCSGYWKTRVIAGTTHSPNLWATFYVTRMHTVVSECMWGSMSHLRLAVVIGIVILFKLQVPSSSGLSPIKFQPANHTATFVYTWQEQKQVESDLEDCRYRYVLKSLTSPGCFVVARLFIDASFGNRVIPKQWKCTLANGTQYCNSNSQWPLLQEFSVVPTCAKEADYYHTRQNLSSSINS